MKGLAPVILLYTLVSSQGLSASSDRALKIVSKNKNGGRLHTMVIRKGESNGVVVTRQERDWRHLLENFGSALRSTFLPFGFPSQTPAGYLRYATWSSIQDMSTQLRSVVATQRVLEGVGVGKEGATALSAALNFLVRDGCGILSSLLFTSLAAPQFKSDVKRWRLFADIILDVGITLEISAAHFPPSLFLPLISVANIFKAMCGVAAGACSGPINLFWARGSDISDISAKFGAQNTLTGALGLVFAAIFARSVSTLPSRPLWLLYGALTLLHIYANRRCMRLITFNSFNTLRLDMVISRFLQVFQKEGPPPVVPSPSEVARKEPLLFFPMRGLGGPRHPIRLGVSFNEFLDHTREHTRENPRLLLGLEPQYWIAVGRRARNPFILVAFPTDSDSRDRAKAYFHARLLDQILVDGKYETVEEAEAIASRDVEKAWNSFTTSCLRVGWDLAETELKSRGYEVAIERV